MNLHEISWTLKNICGIWLFLLFSGYVWNALYSIKHKNYSIIFWECLGLIASIAMLEILCADVHRLLAMEKSALAVRLTSCSVFLFIALLLIFTILLGVMEQWNYLERKRNSSFGVISLFSDVIPVGICYYRDGGKIILFNRCMERLCHKISGKALANGEVLAAAVMKEENFHIGENEVWSFHLNHKKYGNRTVHELIAYNVTELSEKNAELQKENERLLAHNRRLREYYLKIDEIVREQELLQAKIDIHDGMNELILRTRVSAAAENKEEILPVLKKWEQNILLLAKKRTEDKDYHTEIKALADMLGIQLEGITDLWDVPEKYQELFCQAAREAIANAVKHANAHNMKISVEKHGEEIVFIYINDGSIPKEAIVFKGGLVSLEKRVKDQGGYMETKQGDHFTLLIKMKPEGAKS